MSLLAAYGLITIEHFLPLTGFASGDLLLVFDVDTFVADGNR